MITSKSFVHSLKKEYCHIKRNCFTTKNYLPLSFFDPDPEITKFYKTYLNTNYTKIELEKLLIDKSSKFSNPSFTEKLSKLLSNLEFKNQLDDVKKIILDKIATSNNPSLSGLSQYYFKLSGKMVRPLLLILISKYISECVSHASTIYGISNNSKTTPSFKHKNIVHPFAACVEVIHNASLLQDDIIDNSDMRRNYKTAHNIYGIKNTVFGSNYILSKGASLIAELNIDPLNEIYSSIVYYLTYGECQQTLKKKNIEDLDEYFNIFMNKTYYKTASLIALSLRGIGIIYDLDQDIQKKLFNLGIHLGFVFQLVDDVMDVQSESSMIQKPVLKDLKEGVINSHILFEIQDDKTGKVLEMVKRKFTDKGDIDHMLDILKNGNGILKTRNLTYDHMIESLINLEDPFFINNSTKKTLLMCFDMLLNRNY